MRVLHLTEEFPPGIYGGVGTAVGGLVAASARTGIEVAVLLVGAEGDPSYRQPAETRRSSEDPALTQCRGAGIHVRPTSYHAAEEMGVRWVQAWRPDVLHLHSYWLWRMARAMRERTGAPLVYTVHSLVRAEYEIAQGSPECVTAWQTQENAIASADRIVALTRSEGELIATYLPTARKRVRVVGNGIDDCPVAREAANRRHQNDTPLVLYAGRFVERKGIRELLAAIPLVVARRLETRFVLVGGHCSGEDMASYWLPPGFEPYRDRVQFTDWLSPDALARWYREADVVVVPSWYEPFGMVVLEGMLYGLPVAAADVGGPAEILEHEHTGLLFPPRDAGALADALIRLVKSPSLRQRLGQAAAREVRRTWLYSRVLERMRAVYQEVMMGGAKQLQCNGGEP